MARLHLHPRKELLVGKRRVTGDVDGSDGRARPFDDDDVGTDGSFAWLRRIGFIGCRLDLGRGETALQVQAADRGRGGGQLRIDEDGARLEGHERAKLAGGYRHVAANLDVARNAIDEAALDLKHHGKRSFGFLSAIGDLSLPVALLTKVILDPGLGVLQQVLFDRSFLLDRHERAETVLRKTIALESHRDHGAGIYVDGEVDARCLFDLDRLERGGGKVEPAFAEILHVFVETPSELFAEIRIPWCGAQLRQERRPPEPGFPIDVDIADLRERARLDLKRQQRPIWIVPFFEHRLYPGPRVAVLRIEVLEEPRSIFGAANRRALAEAVGDRAAQRALRERDVPRKADPLNGVERNQVVAKRDATRRPVGRVDLNILKPSEAVKVDDRLTDIGHVEWLPDACLEQVEERRILRRRVLEIERDGIDRAPNVGAGR